MPAPTRTECRDPRSRSLLHGTHSAFVTLLENDCHRPSTEIMPVGLGVVPDTGEGSRADRRVGRWPGPRTCRHRRNRGESCRSPCPENPAARKNHVVYIALALVGRLRAQRSIHRYGEELGRDPPSPAGPVPDDTDIPPPLPARHDRGSTSPPGSPVEEGSTRSCWHPTMHRAARAAGCGGRPNESGPSRTKATCAPGTACGNRSMNHRVPIPETTGKDGGILVLRRHDRAESGERT